VAAGLAELELWLRDQVESGLAAAHGAGPGAWEDMAARLVDAQAGRAAERVRALGRIGTAPDWPGRLLEELALLRLLAVGHRRGDALPPHLRAAVRARVGLPSAADTAASVRDTWRVLGRCDFPADQVRGRRVWLRGAATGRVAMLTAFAPHGRTPDSPAEVGTEIDADLAFHPAEWRAAVVRRDTERPCGPPLGGTVADALASWSRAVAADPWLDAWPVVVRDAVVGRADGWWLADPSGAALPLHADAAPPWRWAAASGGAPATVAAEWTPHGLRPLTVWPDGADPVHLAPDSPPP
jgi:hypothetical protein